MTARGREVDAVSREIAAFYQVREVSKRTSASKFTAFRVMPFAFRATVEATKSPALWMKMAMASATGTAAAEAWAPALWTRSRRYPQV